ncbi:MAG: choice-of-anchor Q domain-containing protein [Thermodesulfobacteriota bacterium]
MSRFISFKWMAASFILCLVFAGFSNADTFTVTNLDDLGAGSLRQAVLDANANENGPGVVDEIVFADGVAGTIEFDMEKLEEAAAAEPASGNEMKITDDVNIIGPGKDVITIDAKNQAQIFNIEGSIIKFEANAVEERIKVSISGLRFINGASKVGGAIFNSEELSVDSCEFSNNQASGGGAIFNSARGIITEIKDSNFIMNTAYTGGAIALEGIIEDIIIRLADEEMIQEPTLGKISGSTFDQNNADRQGGAIAATSGATIYEISSTSFTNNEAGENGGGAIYIDGEERDIEQEAAGESRASEVLAETKYHLNTLSDCEFNNNTAPAGGAILNISGKIAMIADCNFIGNNAIGIENTKAIGVETAADPEPEPTNTAAGGAIANVGGLIVDMMRTTFSSNTSLGFGGALVNAAQRSNDAPKELTAQRLDPEEPDFQRALIINIQDCTFDENVARISGGAIANGSSSIEMVNTTFSENAADETGGAIYNLDIAGGIPDDGGGEDPTEEKTAKIVEIFTAPIVFASFTTFARNEAGDEGGAIFEQYNDLDPAPVSESIHLRHTVLALNVGGNCGGLMAEDEGGNHSDDETCPLFAGNLATIALGELADNGGPTKTIALLEGDPIDSAVECTAITMFGVETEALDPIVPVDVDQRGAPRAFGDNCDAGAFEFGAVVPGGFFHNPISPAIADNINKLTAEEATPEGRVAFLWGFKPGSRIIGGKTCNGIEIAINRAKILGIATSSTEGEAELRFYIPLIGDFEFTILTQAVDIKTCATSEVIEDVVRKE